jgi:hypothetical protein
MVYGCYVVVGFDYSDFVIVICEAIMALICFDVSGQRDVLKWRQKDLKS